MNDVKIIVLEAFEKENTLTMRQLTDQTYEIYMNKFGGESTYTNHYYRIANILSKYMKHKHPVFKREKIGNVYQYTINGRGLERLKQLRTVFRFFGVYRLKREGTQLLVKTKSGNYAVNPVILPYAPLFCDVPMEKLKMYVGLL
jgi:beta-galactosidase/beta-glucuronidase